MTGLQSASSLVMRDLVSHVRTFPTAIEVPLAAHEPEHGQALAGGAALERATSVLNAFARSGVSDASSTAFREPEPSESFSGHLVSRDHATPTPTSVHLPALSALLDVSRRVG